MKTYQDDLGYLQAGIEDGQAYLLSDQLYGMLAESQPSGGEYPALTLGSMLLSLARLKVEAQTPAQQAEVQQVEAKLDHLRSRWQIAWGKKAAWEFRARVKQWETYLNEVRQDSEKFAGYYRYEVRQRVLLALLEPEALDLEPAYVDMLHGLDAIVEARMVPGPFIWEAELEAAFPREPFWFLYGKLRE